MSDRQITIAIDAMGGDNSPYKSLKGAEIFSKKHFQVDENLLDLVTKLKN